MELHEFAHTRKTVKIFFLFVKMCRTNKDLTKKKLNKRRKNKIEEVRVVAKYVVLFIFFNAVAFFSKYLQSTLLDDRHKRTSLVYSYLCTIIPFYMYYTRISRDFFPFPFLFCQKMHAKYMAYQRDQTIGLKIKKRNAKLFRSFYLNLPSKSYKNHEICTIPNF